MHNKRRKNSKTPLDSLSPPPPPPPPATSNAMEETQTKESSPPPSQNYPHPPREPPTHRKPPPKSKKKPLSKKKLALINQKLSLLSQNLRPIPFAPNAQTLETLAPHEPLFRSLNLWGFLNLRLDLDTRADLLSELIANYDPLKHHSLVLGLRINLSRADLGRALQLPSNKGQKTSASEFHTAQFGGRDEVAAVLSGFISNWMVFLDDAAILPEEVVTANRLVREGQPNKVDWAGLMWCLVEKEILGAPENGSCYYASHLQCLIKYQKPRLFEDAAAAEVEMEEVEQSEVATVEEDGDAEMEEVGDVGSEKCGPGLSLGIGGDGDGDKKGEEEEEKVVSGGKEDACVEHGWQECDLNDSAAGDLIEDEPDKEGSGDGLELFLPDHGLKLSREEPGEVGRVEVAECSLPESELNYNVKSTAQFEELIKQEPDDGGRVEGVQHCLPDGRSYTAGALIEEEEDKGEGGEADHKGKRVDTGFEDELATAKFPTLERLASSDFMQVMGTNNNLSFGLDQSNGELLDLGSDMQSKSMGLDMGPGDSFLFGNDQKRPSDEIDDQGNKFHQNHQQKRFRGEQPWEQASTITGFNECMEQLEIVMGKAKMDLVEKEHACMRVQVQVEYLNGVLQQKDDIIQSLQKTTVEEMRKREMEANRFNHDLKTLSNILFGCKKALKDTQTAFDEYRKRFPLDNEPNKQCQGTGGDVLGATGFREQCSTDEDEMHQIAQRMISDFSKSWYGELNKHDLQVSTSGTKLVQLREEVKLLKELMAKSKGQKMFE